jgi:hypothetical protein
MSQGNLYDQQPAGAAAWATLSGIRPHASFGEHLCRMPGGSGYAMPLRGPLSSASPFEVRPMHPMLNGVLIGRVSSESVVLRTGLFPVVSHEFAG